MKDSLPLISRIQTDEFWGAIAGEHRLLACRIRLPAECSSEGNETSCNLLREKIPRELTLSGMSDELFGTNRERVCGVMTRRLFLRATLATGATLLAGR